MKKKIAIRSFKITFCFWIMFTLRSYVVTRATIRLKEFIYSHRHFVGCVIVCFVAILLRELLQNFLTIVASCTFVCIVFKVQDFFQQQWVIVQGDNPPTSGEWVLMTDEETMHAIVDDAKAKSIFSRLWGS